MATELAKVGASVEQGTDFIEITPPKTFKEAEIETYNDHRMLMCFALLSLSDVPVTLLDPNCVNKTPQFLKRLAKSLSRKKPVTNKNILVGMYVFKILI